MKLLNAITIITMILISSSTYSQELRKHEWKNRIIVILTSDNQNAKYNEQLETFENETEGFKERKLVVYHATPTKYKTGFQKNNWKKSSQLYDRFKQSDSDFEIILLGLDGGVKLRQENLLTVRKLYGTIDAMPMRRREIESKK